MDTNLVRSLVIQYRDSGLTYQEISDVLKEEHNINRSRQALQGMYSRAIRGNYSKVDKERKLATPDIINIYCLGYSMKEVTKIVNNMGYDLEYGSIVKVIKENERAIENTEMMIVRRINESVDSVRTIEGLIEEVTYKEIVPKEKCIIEYIAKAYRIRLMEIIQEVLIDAYEITDDKKVAKLIVDDLDIDINKIIR